MSSTYESEATTRKKRIDKAILKAGWTQIIQFSFNSKYNTAAVEEYPTDSGPADYVLFHDGAPLAVIEGKKVSLAPQNVISQAERYARAFQGSILRFGEYNIPFVYSTNGEEIWFRDLRWKNSRSRQVSEFHRPEALREMLQRDAASSEQWLHSNSVEHPWLRPYQIDAIKGIEDSIFKGRRKMMVAMATGTGKTVTIIDLLHRLMKSKTAHRILFLVDRRALAAQAISAMAMFEAEPGLKFDRIYEVYGQRFKREDLCAEEGFDPKLLPNSYLTNPKLGTSFVYVSTIQRMRINLFGNGDQPSNTGDEEEYSDAECLDIPIHAFDCIIADECHRGYSPEEDSKWREVLDYFDAVKIGLTATPALHTKAYFGDVVYQYDYEQAVREGYLVDYDPIVISSQIRMKGLFLHEGEEVTVVDTETGRVKSELLEDEREFNASELEHVITAPDSNLKIVKEFMKHAREFEKLRGHFPKTIVFASNDLPHRSHADQIVNYLRDEAGQGDDFASKITGSPTVDRPLQRIREFRNRQNPKVVVTVDMLSTGVDIPAVEALLFVRPIKSRILFEQMLGRGTRKCLDIRKTHFMVFDAVGVLDYFSKATAFTTDPVSRPTRPIKEIVDAIADNKDKEYNIRVLVKRLQRIDKNITQAGRDLLSEFIPMGDIRAFAQQLPTMFENDYSDTVELFCNSRFQYLLENYPTPPPTFFIDSGSEDVVTSEKVFKTRDGKELKPGDYIQAFESFIKENPEHIEALPILLHRPKDFDTADLEELRTKLQARIENFSEANLRKAYNNDMADIISIIRHAALGETLGTTQQRIHRAMSSIRAGMTLTPEQEKWMNLIENHLSHNLLIGKEHFEDIPFSRYGSWKKANAVFDGKLESLLHEINLAVVQ
jgi:type I restriction enzyme R subunit